MCLIHKYKRFAGENGIKRCNKSYVNSLRLLQIQPNPPLTLSISDTFIFGKLSGVQRFFWGHTVIKGHQHHVTSLQCSLCLKSLQKSDKKKKRKVNLIICW